MADVDRNPTDPSADDPFVPGTQPTRSADEERQTEREQEAVEMARRDPRGDQGPTYERHQDPEDTTGGSTDPHNTLGHEDSGNES